MFARLFLSLLDLTADSGKLRASQSLRAGHHSSLRKRTVAIAAAVGLAGALAGVSLVAEEPTTAEAISFCNAKEPTSIRGWNSYCNRGAYAVYALNSWSRHGNWAGYRTWAYSSDGLSYANRGVMKG